MQKKGARDTVNRLIQTNLKKKQEIKGMKNPGQKITTTLPITEYLEHNTRDTLIFVQQLF